MSLRADVRGQSVGIARFFLGVFVIGAIMWYILDRLARPMATESRNATTNATFKQGSTWMVDFVDVLPAVIIVTAVLGVIVLAIYQREVLR